MASAEFDDNSQAKKPTVQVGDPFTEKLLMEACLELMKDDSIISIQDMGAAGLTSSSVEMAFKGELGIEIDLDKVQIDEDFDDGLEVTRLLMAAYMSAEQGKTIAFPPPGLDNFIPAVARGEWNPRSK